MDEGQDLPACPWSAVETEMSRAEKQLLLSILSYNDQRLRTPDRFMSPCGRCLSTTYAPGWVPLFPGATVLMQMHLLFSHNEVYIGRGHTITYTLLARGVVLRPMSARSRRRWYVIPCCDTAHAARQCLRRALASLGHVPFGFGSEYGTNCIAVSEYVAFQRTRVPEATVARVMLVALFASLFAYLGLMWYMGSRRK